jgi:hypothetical protein
MRLFEAADCYLARLINYPAENSFFFEINLP